MQVPKIDQVGISKFLRQYDKNILEQIRCAKFQLKEREQNILKFGTVLKESVSKQEIENAETRLRIRLPESYKNFLNVSNGIYSIYGDGKDDSIWSLDKITYLRDYDAELIDDNLHESIIQDDDYFDYGPNQNSVLYRSEYLEHLIAISPYYDGYIFLINPKVSMEVGELEIWDLSHRHPGAFRYKSFNSFLEFFYRESIETIVCWNKYT